MRNRYTDFRARKTELVTLAVSSPGVIRRTRQLVGARYPMLADPGHHAARAYGVYNLLGDGRAAPSVFIVRDDGRIHWTYVGQAASDRPTTAQILEQLP